MINANVEYRLISYSDYNYTMLCKEENKADILEYAKLQGYQIITHPISTHNGYHFGYNLTEFILLKKQQVLYEIFFQLPSFSLTDRYIIPLDKIIQNAAWTKCRFIEEKKYLIPEVEMVYRLASAIFRDKTFKSANVDWINEYSYILNNDEFVDMLSKVFFKYTNRLLFLIKEQQFLNIFEDYLGFSQY
ncbi:MAG: hypothetical protein K5662_07665 [Lachnospiraceae bacterium]|nr:hypothetical protein [Lachnospiraceae bacterium]